YSKFPIDHCTPAILTAIYAIFPIYSLTDIAPSTHERHFSYISALPRSNTLLYSIFPIDHFAPAILSPLYSKFPIYPLPFTSPALLSPLSPIYTLTHTPPTPHARSL